MLSAVAAAALICLDPGHGTVPAIGAQTELIGPGSHIVKIKDGGGTAGEADVVLAIASTTSASPAVPPPSLILTTCDPGPIGSVCAPIAGTVPCPGSRQISAAAATALSIDAG